MTAAPLTAEEEQRFRFSSIAHGEMAIMNPLSGTVLNEAIGELDLTPGMRVLDLGCGKGEALRRIVERYDVQGVGVDLSPFAIAQATAIETAPNVSSTSRLMPRSSIFDSSE